MASLLRAHAMESGWSTRRRMNMTSFVRVLAVSAVLATGALAADITGKWTGKVETPNGSRDVTYTFKQEGEKLTGSVPGRDSETPITDGSVKGDDVTFSVVRNFGGQERKSTYTGKVAGNEMKLKYQMRGEDRELVLKKQ
jgi:hypothetical protein